MESCGRFCRLLRHLVTLDIEDDRHGTAERVNQNDRLATGNELLELVRGNAGNGKDGACHYRIVPIMACKRPYRRHSL